MKLLVTAILILVMAGIAQANPFLVSDPNSGVTHYKFTGPAWVPASTPAQTDGSLKLDVATAVSGTNNLTVAACRNEPAYGELCSPFVPFSFVRPSAPSAPAGLKLAP
jgi:hypothetical protein